MSESPILREPVEVELSGQPVIVKDPPFRKVLKIAPAIAEILPMMSSGEEADSADSLQRFAELAANDKAYDAFKVCASACTNKGPDFFDEMTLSDFAILLEAAEKAVNWESLKRLFQKGMKVDQPTSDK